MEPTAIVWAATAAALIVVAVLAGVNAKRAADELSRISKRVNAFADLPLNAALAKAGTDAARLSTALDQMTPLVARAQTAIATIRRGPIPPDVVGGIVRIGVEVQALQQFIP
ncbi:hypothetical protein WPS_19670 [Vulcanimicrobium alpinum]|uniref:Uncharacterized protein n=1 Tax=Vulcanimicrobium alpinum TaxID=3016050 RepID=A0AAN1XWI7_UNVUL|nr:hypothetical protein [Vulcanimicrobium alpinum]BDE06691.1 hypothetical protein WPS_19670 [Vulcanimicrobium alpinum]